MGFARKGAACLCLFPPFVYVLKSTSYNLPNEARLTGENIVERGLSPNVYIIVAALLLTFDVIISRNFIYEMSVLH